MCIFGFASDDGNRNVGAKEQDVIRPQAALARMLAARRLRSLPGVRDNCSAMGHLPLAFEFGVVPGGCRFVQRRHDFIIYETFADQASLSPETSRKRLPAALGVGLLSLRLLRRVQQR